MPNKLYKKFKKYDSARAKNVQEISGLLGVPINGSQIVEVPGRNGFVYVRLRNTTSELIQALNDTVSNVYGLPVKVKFQNGRYIVSGRDTARYSDWGSQSPYLPKHGAQHSFAPELGYGGDVVWVYSRQFMPINSIPSGNAGANVLYVSPHVYRNPVDGSWKYIGGQFSPDILSSKPLNNQARMMLLYWDLSSNTPQLISGSTLAENLTGTSQILPYLPVLSNSQHVPLSAIRLVSGSNRILWDNIYDVRQFATTQPQTFDGGFSVWDEGVPVGTGTTINFIGERVSATISGSVINVYVSGSTTIPVDQIGVYVTDDGIAVGTGTVLNFGNNLSATISGSIVTIDAVGGGGGGGGGGGLMIQDEGTNIGTGIALNFVGYGTASISGTIAQYDSWRRISRKTSDENRTAIVLSDDSELKLQNVGTGQVWSFSIKLMMSSSSTNGDYFFGMNTPTGVALWWGSDAGNGGTYAWDMVTLTATNGGRLGTATGSIFSAGSLTQVINGDRQGISLFGIMETTYAGGDVAFQWSDKNAGHTGTVYRNSYIEWMRLQ